MEGNGQQLFYIGILNIEYILGTNKCATSQKAIYNQKYIFSISHAP